MPDSPLGGGQYFEDAGANAADSRGTACTGGTAGAKGSYQQLIASTAHDAIGIIVFLGPVSLDVIDYAVDIAVGAAASEQIIIPDLVHANGGGNNFIWDACHYFPLRIPAGSRIAARAAGTGTQTVYVSAVLVYAALDNDVPDLGSVEAIGVATRQGTTVDPGGTINTKGAWAQLTAATARELRSLNIIAHCPVTTAPSTFGFLVDIGIGAGGSEQVILSNIHVITSATAGICVGLGPLPMTIPAGTRIAARSQCSGNDATDRLLHIALYGTR